MYTNKELAIIISTNNNICNIKKIILSIKKSSIKPGQVIIVSNKPFNYCPIDSYVKILKCNKKNQVLQRNFGFKFLNKNIKIILQLDDKFILTNNCLKNLINNWNQSNNKVCGIGLNEKSILKKANLFHKIFLIKNNNQGKILLSGSNNNYYNTNNNLEWLKGGASSWKLKYISFAFNRKFPEIFWSVYEDVIFSYYMSKTLNFHLKFSKQSILKRLPEKKTQTSLGKLFLKGVLQSKLQKSFVKFFRPKFSTILCYYSVITSSIFSIVYFSVSLNFKKIVINTGRFVGIFFKTYTIKLK